MGCQLHTRTGNILYGSFVIEEEENNLFSNILFSYFYIFSYISIIYLIRFLIYESVFFFLFRYE